MIGLALSGGGSRAIAFHLGCLRALWERNVLEKVSVISAVSGGSVIAAMYAYSSSPFEEFDSKVVGLLRLGLQRSILGHLVAPDLAFRVLATNAISRPLAVLAALAGNEPPLRRWASRSDAFERSLKRLYENSMINEVRRPNLDVVLNACEMRTGTAFRFGNRRSGTWRLGEICGNQVNVAHAVACSAAYPMFLPAFDRVYQFTKHGKTKPARVILTDGGVFDNLGISCLEPGRDDAFSLHVYPVDYIICCSAGHGQFSGRSTPFNLFSRAKSSFEIVFRKNQDGALQRLYIHEKAGNIKGFVLPYLGQQDASLPLPPRDLIKREDVFGYPTNFAAMSEDNITRISLRGEQLTRTLLNYYCPQL